MNIPILNKIDDQYLVYFLETFPMMRCLRKVISDLVLNRQMKEINIIKNSQITLLN